MCASCRNRGTETEGRKTIQIILKTRETQSLSSINTSFKSIKTVDGNIKGVFVGSRGHMTSVYWSLRTNCFSNVSAARFKCGDRNRWRRYKDATTFTDSERNLCLMQTCSEVSTRHQQPFIPG